MLTADGQGKASKDSMMRLLDKSPNMADMTTTTGTPATTTSTPMTAETTMANDAASPIKKLSQRFNITSPDKPKLAMELVCKMDTPQKVPLMRKLVKGSTISIECHNNVSKKFVHIQQCSSHKSAITQAHNPKFIHKIVDMLGAGAKKGAVSLNEGALWLCGGLADIFRDEFVQAAACAGATCISRMSAEATAVMWTNTKLTKAKSRKILGHLLDWFKKPITAKEPDVDAFGKRLQVKQKYASFQLTSEKGKKQSKDDIKKQCQVIAINWVSDPFEAAEDKLISQL
jgi:hypothetical protein